MRKQTDSRVEMTAALPEDLRKFVETYSGLSMSDVTVHYNSHKPGKIQSLAYAQGTDIYLKPGQEQHLAHEAWHVVQQKRGRVNPTIQVADVDINDDPQLEVEAEIMALLATNGPILQGPSTRLLVLSRRQAASGLEDLPCSATTAQRIITRKKKKMTEDEVQQWYGTKTLGGVIRYRLVLEAVVNSDLVVIDLDGMEHGIEAENLAQSENEFIAALLEQGDALQSILASERDKKHGKYKKGEKGSDGEDLQTKVATLLARIRDEANNERGRKLVKLAQKSKKGPKPSLSASNYDALYKTSQALVGVLDKGVAIPEDILDPAILNEPKYLDMALLTLKAAIPFLETILAIMLDDDDCLAIFPIVTDIILSQYGKNCVTSMGRDVFKIMSSGGFEKR